MRKERDSLVGRRFRGTTPCIRRALEAILTSADYNAELAERWGWVTRVLPATELDAFVDATVARLASFDRQALATAKAMVNRATLRRTPTWSPHTASSRTR
jgi:enoyl-CoA hydratase/carnithine racemase